MILLSGRCITTQSLLSFLSLLFVRTKSFTTTSFLSKGVTYMKEYKHNDVRNVKDDYLKSFNLFPFRNNHDDSHLRFILYSSNSDGISPSSSQSSSSSFTSDEVNRLRTRAKQLRDEANLAEKILRSSRKLDITTKLKDIDDLINKWLLNDEIIVQQYNNDTVLKHNDNITTTDHNTTMQNNPLISEMRDNKMSLDYLKEIIQRIHERSKELNHYQNSIPLDIKNPIADGGNPHEEQQVYDNQILDEKLKILTTRIIESQKILDLEKQSLSTYPNDNSDSNISTKLLDFLQDLDSKDKHDHNLSSLVSSERYDGEQLTNSKVVELSNHKDTQGSETNTTKSLAPRHEKSENIQDNPMNSSNFNMTKIMDNIIRIPRWVPSHLTPFLVISAIRRNENENDYVEITSQDWKSVRSDVLSGSMFSCNRYDYFDLAAIYRGSFVPRTNSSKSSILDNIGKAVPQGNTKRSSSVYENNTAVSNIEKFGPQSLSATAFRDVQQRLEKSPLSRKLQFFLIEDSDWRPGDQYAEPLPAILAVPRTVVPEQKGERGKAAKLLAGISVISTIFTTFAYAVSSYALNAKFFDAVINKSNLNMLHKCLPIFIGVIFLSGIHEVAHIIVAKSTGTKIGLPVPLPSLQIGTFGSITPLRSFPQSRTTLFDLALSGPIVTMTLSLLSIILGIFLTINTPLDKIQDLAVVPVAIMKSSFLVGSLVSLLASKIMILPLSQPIPIHPLFMIGLTGLISSAVNLLPIGRLDGGRASTALFGRRSATLLSFFTLFYLALTALTRSSVISIFWGLLVILFQKNEEIPVRDEITELDNTRAGLYVAAISLTILTLAPFPGGPGSL